MVGIGEGGEGGITQSSGFYIYHTNSFLILAIILFSLCLSLSSTSGAVFCEKWSKEPDRTRRLENCPSAMTNTESFQCSSSKLLGCFWR